MDDLDFMDWVAYNIFIGNGKEFGFDDDEEEETLFESEEEAEELETEQQETKPKTYERNYSGKNSREF